MSDDRLHIHSIGYTANNNPSRATRSGAEYEELLPSPDWQSEVVKRNADVSQTVKEMQALIKKSAWQTKELSKRLLGKDTYTTCKNIWHFLFEHCKYKEDDEGQEQLRTPALSWYLRTIRGIDCDDFSIFASTILYNIGIPHYLRIAKYEGKTYFQHVYVVVPQTNNRYITIDAVLDEYDTEKEPIETKDFLVMNTTNLNGIDVTVLSGIEDEGLNELHGVIEGIDFERTNELEGLGQTPSQEDELGAIYRHLVRTRDLVRRNPHYIKQVEHPETFLGMLDYALGYWDTDKRDEALGILAIKEEELNGLHGLGAMPEGYEDTQLYYGIEGLNGVVALGKVKAKRAFFQKVKQAAKKAGQGIKKVAKAVVRYNPATIAVRGGVLLAMKTNFLKLAEKIKWGYLTQDEARNNGFDVGEWQNAKNQLQKIENMFVKVLQGKPEALKKAILSGRAGGLSGINGFDGAEDELGAVVATATGASITTAMPFIKKIMDFAKKINFKKLVAKVNPAKLMRGKKRAEKEKAELPETETANDTSEESAQQSSIPDNTPQDTNNEDSEYMNGKTGANKRALPSAKTSGGSGGSNNSGGSNSTGENTSEETSTEENSNLPAQRNASTPATNDSAKETGESTNPLTKAMDWVKENPGKTALIAGGLILAISSSARKAIGLGGTPKRSRKRKGTAKKNPPKTISGTKSKGKGKGKGKGGTPRVTL